MAFSREDIINKIKGCLALAKCETASEAATAAYMAQKLIARYGIDEALLLTDKPEVPANEQVVEHEVFKFDGPRVVTWVLNLGSALAEVNNCKLWFVGGDNWWPGFKAHLMAAGREEDIATISYMMQFLFGEIEDIAKVEAKNFRKEFGYSGGKNWSNSFKVGAVSKIRDRLTEARNKAVEEARAQAVDVRNQVTSVETVTDKPGETPVVKYELAVINNAIELWGNRKKRADEWAESKHKFYKGHSRATSLHGTAWNMGRDAGARINLNSGPRLTSES